MDLQLPSNRASFDAELAAASLIGDTTELTVQLRSSNATTQENDVEISFKVNNVTLCTHDLKVRTPYRATPRSIVATCVHGRYVDEISYDLVDQYNQTLPYWIEVNEQFDPQSLEILWTGGTDWAMGPEVNHTVDPSGWIDLVGAPQFAINPDPLCKFEDEANEDRPVIRFTGQFRAGSLTSGRGSLIRSSAWGKDGGLRCTWVLMLGKGRHE